MAGRYARIIGLLCAAALCGPAAADTRVLAVALFKDKVVLEINGKNRMLRSGERSPEGVLVVRATSREVEIEADGKRTVLALDGRIVNDFGPPAAPTTVRLVPNGTGHYVVDGKINGHGIEFLVDTGATLIAINKTAARRMGLQYRVEGEPGQVQTASGLATAYYVKLDEVAVRTINLRNVPAVVVDGDYPAVALLGQSFLNRLDMRRDGAVMELIAR